MRPVSVLDRAIYIHQFNYGVRESSWAAILTRCREASFNLVKLKAVDGTEFMGVYDQVAHWPNAGRRRNQSVYRAHPLAVTSVDRWTELSEEADQAGIELIPWTVPHGINIDAELEKLLELATRSKMRVELDIEPYEGFWRGPWSNLVYLVRELTQAGVEVWIDAHVSGYTTSVIPFAELAPMVARWLGQSYWTTFQKDAAPVIEYEADFWASLPAQDWGAIFPAGGYPDFQRAAEAAAARDAAEIALWSYNVAPPAAFPAFSEVS